MFVHVRDYEMLDKSYLLDFDIKASAELTWTSDEWQEAINNDKILVADSFGKVLGCVVASRSTTCLNIRKVVVNPQLVRQGIGRKLIERMASYGYSQAFKYISLTIPEARIRPGDPSDLSAWLVACGFRGTAPILKNHFTFYGEPENGVRFVRNNQ
jgi:GNAT superfamily N-acetyltransferase